MSMKGIILVFAALASLTVTQGFLFGPNEVCYGKYGCFKKQPTQWPIPWPSLRLLQWPIKLPQDPSKVQTSFHVFTREGSGKIDDHDQSKLQATDFDIARRTIFVIHGWLESKYTWALRMKNALLDREDCNVILVDWSKGSQIPYDQAAGNTRLVGAQVAELIRFLISSSSGSPDLTERFYIVGFSLGAQTAGYAGAYLKGLGMILGRITGLDPAGPGFIGNVVTNEFRLDPGDAAYVDVVHTDAGGIGTDEMVGHTAFFPNGGHDQPGCLHKVAIIKLLDLLKLRDICDHLRAPEFYIASVENPSSWIASPCMSFSDCKNGKYRRTCNDKCPTMGYGADTTKRDGTFYLKTNSQAPFRRIE
ncbi:hypothetical protein OS493_000242 [Desmophyllum pertusum]|uniref:Lipase domain-containing protein n=1 Tax=Desmophyllum pertusum TaxID=174260 RepID=A0A9X0A789_9CNID|nr:hypothetical protein OS493_000242 [Desmophyllum pertusum]